MPSRIIDGYKFQFYSADRHEPPHVHVVKAEKRAKLWLRDLSVSKVRNFNNKELNRVLEMVREHQDELLEWYHGFFS